MTENVPDANRAPREYDAMIDSARTFLDRLAAARPDAATIAALEADLARWSRTLEGFATDEAHQYFAMQSDTPGRGQTMAPRLVIETTGAEKSAGHVTFGRYFLGRNGAVHGGAIPLVFDEIMGRLAGSGDRLPARTAYIHVDYRAITPIDRPVQVAAWFESEEGRKRNLRAELRDGDTLCAEAHGLFVQLKPGQP